MSEGIYELGGWQLSGSCRGLDSSVFFHPDGERGYEREARVRRAKRICRSCAVQRECRQFALVTAQPYGIWGGMSEQERRLLRHRAEDRAEAAGRLAAPSG
ncbi:WhiB family transcriptional regulator [Nocardia sp. NPDC051832]|uniref:WhiB family transcriptional regulator n=1 Tax=Nocardia sp. NPDC051832 TaxID=3155673 RepID=UPI00343D3509